MSRRENFVTKSALPWQAKEVPLATYYAEIGDTEYGKSGHYREKVNIGAFPVGMHDQLRMELLHLSVLSREVHGESTRGVELTFGGEFFKKFLEGWGHGR